MYYVFVSEHETKFNIKQMQTSVCVKSQYYIDDYFYGGNCFDVVNALSFGKYLCQMMSECVGVCVLVCMCSLSHTRLTHTP